eukprot:6893065-Pyramimonas_sp.AAC.1
MGLPSFLRAHFRLPCIAARHLGLKNLNGRALHPNALIAPQLCVLPVGWSWSLLLCQSVVRHAISAANIPTSLTFLGGLPAVVVKGGDVAVA